MLIKEGTCEVDISAPGNVDDQQLNSSRFLAHPDEPEDRYSEYLRNGSKSTDEMNNPRNLFADSNSEDQKWFKSTMQYLKRLT